MDVEDARTIGRRLRQIRNSRRKSLRVIAAAYGTVYALVGSGMLDLAQAELDSLMLPATTPDTAGLVGSLAMTQAYVASLRKRFSDVAAPMEAAAELAQRFGEATGDDAFGFAFGPRMSGYTTWLTRSRAATRTRH